MAEERNFNEQARIAARLESVEAQYEELSIRITLPEVIADTPTFTRLMREHSELEPVNELAHRYKKAVKDREGTEEMLEDPDMREMAK
ncbi:MAG: PCRF domain-containing protein, partial [Clostridia bacterium]|nr:PCRF domain-containing protein [Clostridia bacterium]